MKKIFLAFLGAFALLSCSESRLDIPQKGVIATEDFYQTDEDAEMALIAAYETAAMQYMAFWWNDNIIYALWNYPGDDIYSAGENKADGIGQNELHTFRYPINNNFIETGYKSFFQAVYAANLVIDNFKDKADTDIKKRAVAEALVLRSLSYLQLAIGWGTPPIVDHVLAATDRPTNAESQEAVLDFIVNSIDEALPNLGNRQGPGDKNGIYRATKDLANTIKGKALLWKGDYAGAQAALKEVINSGNYQLIDDVAANFHVRGDGSPEKIFELNLVYDASLSGYTQHSQANMSWMWNWRQSRVFIPTGVGAITYNNGWGGINPSQKFIDILLENDGYDSARRKAWVASYDEVLYEMPYPQDGDAPVMGYTETKATDKNRGVYHADGIYAHCGWFMMKVNINAEDIKNSNNERNTRIFRYPEVILMFAECATQTGQDKELALQLVQAIQNRAKSKTVWSSVADVTLENVKKEKLIEMWLEGCRYQDLVRWGDTDELMNNGKVIPNFKDKINEGNATHEGYVDYSDADWCIKLYPELGFKKGKHELFPIPFSEMSVNENMKQNPGW